MKRKKEKSKSLFNKFLNFVEIGGNALPHPGTLFAIFAFSVIILSGIADYFGWQAVHPGTGELIKQVNQQINYRRLNNGSKDTD